MSKILFVYPNKEGYPIIPLGISVLAGILKKAGHELDIFDITFMMPERLDHNARIKTGVVIKVDMEKYWGEGAEKADINVEITRKIQGFKPDLVAFSVVENNYSCARGLFKAVKKATDAPILAGGLFPTVAPQFFIEDKNVDLLCIGEGEYPMLELATRLDEKKGFSGINNLIIKNGGLIEKNPYNRYYDWEPNVFQDWGKFSEKHLLKPFVGKVWRTGFFETSRGCPFQCFYCANHVYQDIFKSLGKYHREKPLDYVMEEISYKKKKYSLELCFFNDENFVMMGEDRFKKFCAEYKKHIDLPFFIQTRADTLLNESKVRALKETGCVTIGIGVESGSERIRKEVLNKPLSNQAYLKAFENCHKYDIRTTANVMMGVPFEKEEDILESAEFCKKIKAKSVSLAIFAPYYGSGLRDISVKHGFIEDKYHDDISMNYTSIMKMPQLSKEKIEELYYKFNSLVYGGS
ncbi:MAG: radical SAM protein [Candidatus Omnitrophota bacterium]